MVDPRQHGWLRWGALPFVVLAVVQASAAWNLLAVPPSRLGLGLWSLAWCGAALWVAYHLFRGFAKALPLAAWFVVLFTVAHTARQWMLTTADYERGRFPFLLASNAILLIVPLIYLVWHYVRRDANNGE